MGWPRSGARGEFAYLNLKQRRRIVEVAIDAAGHRVPVIPGVSATTAAAAIAQATTYQQMGATGILLTLDIYFPLGDRQIEVYFKTAADAVALPIIIYQSGVSEIFALGRLGRAPQ